MLEETQDDSGGGLLLNTESSNLRQTYEIWIFSIIGATLVGLSGIFPLLVIPLESGPALKHGEPAKKLRLMLSFAVGSLLGDVFLHLLPEVWAHIDRDSHKSHTRIGLWVITGLLAFLIVEKIMGDEDEFEHMGDPCGEAEEMVQVQEQKTLSHTGLENQEPLTSDPAHRPEAQQTTINKDKQSLHGPSNLSTSKDRKQKSKLTTSCQDSKSSSLVNEAEGESSSSNNVDGCIQIVNQDNLENNRSIFSTSPVSVSNTENFDQLNGNSCVQTSQSCDNTQVASAVIRNKNNIKISGYLNLMANVVDNFTHGLAVAGSFCISTKVGLVTTAAILLHEIPHEVGDFAILLRSGFDRWKAAKAQFLTASGGVFGAITALSAESTQVAGERTAWILPFTSGGFMYIALVTVVPDLLQEKHGWESLKQVFFICLGISAMAVVTLAFD